MIRVTVIRVTADSLAKQAAWEGWIAGAERLGDAEGIAIVEELERPDFEAYWSKWGARRSEAK